MALSLRKAEFDLNSFGKHLDESDPTLANHVALLLTILSGKKNVPELAMFRNKALEVKRMAELNEIYARGERPPLAEKFSNKKHKSNGNNFKDKNGNVFGTAKNKKLTKITIKDTGETVFFESVKEAARFLSIIEKDKTACAFEHILHTRKEYKNYLFETDGAYFKPLKKVFKAVIAENTKTGEILEFENTNKCAEYLKAVCETKVYREKVKRKIEKGKLLEDWKIRYKEAD